MLDDNTLSCILEPCRHHKCVNKSNVDNKNAMKNVGNASV